MIIAVIPNSPTISLKSKCHGKSAEERWLVLGVFLGGSWMAREEEGCKEWLLEEIPEQQQARKTFDDQGIHEA